MAQIPTVVSPAEVSIPQINPSAAGAPGRALSDIGQTLEASMSFGEQVASALRKQQDEGILLDAENKISADMEKYDTALSAWTDYTNADQLKQNTADELRERYAEMYGNRPDLWQYIEPYLGRELNAYNRTVDAKTIDLTSHFNAAALTDSNLRAIQQAAVEPTLDGKEKIWAEQDAKIDMMVRNGTIWADQGEAQKKTNRARTIATEVDHATNPLNSPEVMEAEMQRLKDYEGKDYVDAQTMAALQDRLGHAYETAVNRQNTHDVLGKVNMAAGQLATMYGKDFAAQMTALSDPNIQKTLGLVDKNGNPDARAIDETRAYLKGQDAAQKEAEGDRDQKLLDHLTPDVLSGKLTETEIKRRANLPEGSKDWIPARVADHLRTQAVQISRENRIENTQERALAKQEAADRSLEVVAQLGSQDGYLTKDDIPALLEQNPGLKYSDALHVVEMRSFASDPFFQSALDQFKQLANNGVLTQSDVGNANIALLIAAQAGTKGNDLIKFASEMTESNTRKAIEQNLDRIVNNPAATYNWSRGAPFQVDNTGLPKVTISNAPISRRQYFEGMKRANPHASDAEINAYLDRKGIH